MNERGESRGMYCLECSYDLRGLERRACPECGKEFDPGNEASWSAVAFSPEARRVADRARWFGDAAAMGFVAPVVLVAMLGILWLASRVLKMLFG